MENTIDGHLLLGHQPLSLQAFHLVVVKWWIMVNHCISCPLQWAKVMEGLRSTGPQKNCSPKRWFNGNWPWYKVWHSNLGLGLPTALWGDFGRSHRTLSSYWRYSGAMKSYCRRICLVLSLEVSDRGRFWSVGHLNRLDLLRLEDEISCEMSHHHQGVRNLDWLHAF